jgi:UDP-N-acetylglucosamine diphosphorylase / glucose-1-phosphate thymidylyltransferase / UDP-N-acetylgalactosamine diphosphorylase / glucosamine-1-phosphate N-acetyltransferase / galactosamine-1-phosphate N-acetyltransferase
VTSLVLLDHTHGGSDADVLAPITTARPLAEVRVGARLIRERWSAAFGLEVTGTIAATRLSGFEEPGSAPTLRDDKMLDAGTIVAMSQFAPSLQHIARAGCDTWTAGDAVVAATLSNRMSVGEVRAAGLTTGATSAALDGWRIGSPWDVIGHLPAMLAADTLLIAGATLPPDSIPDDVRVLGSFPVRIADTAVIEPFVVLDASEGAIVIEAHAVVRSFSRLKGPFVLGAHSQWMTGSGHTVSVGDHCKVSGEVSTSIFCGYANKGHDGFLGHSYLGRWTNLGAGTVTSNLKNTYGTVSFAGADTGLQFLGSILGDHAKTGILTRLTTGSSIGTGANVISDDVVLNVVPPFAWGSSGERYDRARFFQTAERVMARRKVVMSDAMRACLGAVFDLMKEEYS